MSGQTAAAPNAPLRPGTSRSASGASSGCRAAHGSSQPCSAGFEHWLWASPEARALGREVYGF